MTTDTPQPLKAALWMLGGVASFSSMAVAGREVAGVHDTFEMMFFRSLIGIVIVILVAGALGRLREITLRHMPLHLVRNLFHFSGQNLWFYAITVIPLAQVFAIEFTSPIWVVLIAPLVLGERLTRIRLVVAFLGFVGVLIVARPATSGLNIGVITAATAAVMFAATFLCTKLLTRRASVTCILFWLTVMQAPMGLLAAGVDGHITMPTAATAPWLGLIGCAGLFAHLCVTNALRVAPATVVVPLDFLRLPLIALIGMMIYGEAINIYVLLGAAIIFCANYLNIWTEARRVTVS